MTPPDPLKPAPSGEDGPFAHFQWNDSWHTWEQVVDEAAGEEGVVAAYLRPSAPSEASGEDVNAEMLAALKKLSAFIPTVPTGITNGSYQRGYDNGFNNAGRYAAEIAHAAIAAAERLPAPGGGEVEQGLASVDESAASGAAHPDWSIAPSPAGGDWCPWCSEPIRPGEPTGMSDGERMHLSCAAEEMDNATLDRDFGDS